MDTTAANEFINWFKDNSARLAAVNDEMLSALGSDKSGSRQMMKIFKKLEKEVGPRLAAVQEGLLFEVGPGNTKKHGMILSAGGMSELIPVVKHLSNALCNIPEWDVIAFKPAREIGDSARQIIMTSGGERSVAPGDVYVSLHPELTKIGTRLYFNDYKDEDYQVWGQVGFNFLDFCLGEYAVMESVGEISFHPRSEAPAEAFSFPSLNSRFNEAVDAVRSRFTELSQVSQLIRLEQSLGLLSKDVAKIEESIAASADDELNLDFYFWVNNAECEQELAGAFNGFDAVTSPKLTAVGSGFEVALSGAVPREGFSPKEWLAEKVGGVKDFVLLTAFHEPEPVNPMMAQFAALNLIQDKRFDEAAKILKSALRGVGDDDDGQFHGLLGMAYLESGQSQKAVEIYEKALKLVHDDDLRGELLTNKGNALQQCGRLDDAIICFEQALKLDEGKYTRQYNIGQALAQKGMIEKSCEHLGNALKANPGLKEHMLNDPDLKEIKDTEQFKAMIEACSKRSFLGGLFRSSKK